MTNDFNDLDHNDLGTEEIPQRRGVGANLAEAWRSRPLFKLMVIMVVVAAVVGVSVSLFSSGNSTPGAAATLVQPPSIHEPAGGPASPYMQAQTGIANDTRTKEALETGGSAIPTPIGHSSDVGDMTGNNGKSDQLKELEAEVEHQKAQLALMQQQPAQPPQQPQQPQQFDDSLAQAMQHQMSQLMESWTPHGIKEVQVAKRETLEAAAGGVPSTGASTATASAAAANSSTQPQPKTIVSAGTVSYAQLLTEANSDVPGPILAQIVSGPLAGARAVGAFQVANGYSDYLVLQFSVANLKGKDYSINAIALDPDTTLGGMATEVDQRYFTRVILPAAAGFLQGFGSSLGTGNSSIATTGNTTIVTQSGHGITQGLYTGLGQGASTMSQFFQNQANLTKPLVRVAAGTPMGMFFITTVTDAVPQPYQQQGGYPQQAGYPGAYGYGLPGGYGSYPGSTTQAGYYPGSTLPGYGGLGQTANVPYPNYGSAGSAPYGGYGAGVYNGYGGGYSGGYGTTTTGVLPSNLGGPLYGH